MTLMCPSQFLEIENKKERLERPSAALEYGLA